MRRLHIALVIVVVSFFAAIASADTLQFTGTATTTTLTITDPTYPSGVTGYIDPYLGKLTIGSNTVSVIMFCVDPDHEVNFNDTWNVYVTLAPTANWTHTRLNNPTIYGEMAYLASLMLATNDPTTRQEIQTVIWWLADNALTAAVPNGVNVTDWNNAINTYKGNAATYGQTHPTPGGFEILSDVNGSKQEFLVLVPEPCSLILFGSGLAFVSGRLRKRRLQ